MKAMALHLRKLEEQILVSAFLKRRDEKAFLKLYGKYTPTIYQLALRMLGGNSHEAEEAVQDSWVRAVQRLPGFRWESGFRTWLSAITIRCCQEQIRRRSRQQRNIPLDEENLQPLVVQVRRIEADDLDEAIARLPDGYREILVLHDVEGYTHHEIGEFLDINPGTSKSQLFQARRKMRTYLQADVRSEKET